MKRNLNVALKNLDGTPIKEAIVEVVDGKQVVTSESEVTLATVAINALLASQEEDRNLSGEEKVKRFRLSQTIFDAKAGNKDIDISAEDIGLLKKMIAKNFAVLVVGQAFDLLEQGPVPVDKSAVQ